MTITCNEIQTSEINKREIRRRRWIEWDGGTLKEDLWVNEGEKMIRKTLHGRVNC